MPRAVVALSMFSAVLVASPAPALPEHRCHAPRRGRIVASSPRAIVTESVRAFDQFDATMVWRGCVRSTGRQVVLHRGYIDVKGSDTASAFHLAGNFVAFATQSDYYTDPPSSARDLLVFDLSRRSRVVHDGTSDLHALAVSPSGALAWREDNPQVPDPDVAAVLTLHDRSGRRILDSGPSGSLRRMAFRGSLLTWTHDGAPRSARVSGAPTPRRTPSASEE